MLEGGGLRGEVAIYGQPHRGCSAESCKEQH